MTDFVEAGFDVRLEYPSIVDGLRGEVMDFGNCVLRPAVRAEPIRARLEISLKDGLEHQFQACLDHPVGDGGDGDFILSLLQSRAGRIWFLAIGAGHGAAVRLSLCQRPPTSPDCCVAVE